MERDSMRLRRENVSYGNRDELTGCLDFNAFRSAAKRLILQNQDCQYALWYCDLRQFKIINETLGYEAGDSLLRYWIEVISENLSEDEAVGRIAADIVVMLTHEERRENLEKHFTSISDKLRNFFRDSDFRYDVEMLAGIYWLKPQDMISPDINQMLDYANLARKSGRGYVGSKCIFFSDALWERQRRQNLISKGLKQAIDEGEISIWFQPQYNYVTNQMVGVEALCRWEHAILGEILPSEFIPVLEKTGQISQLDRYVWEQVCDCARKWEKYTRNVPIEIAVNVSRMDLQEAGFCQYIYGLVKRYGLSTRSLRLEITESAYMEKPELLITMVEKLQSQGFIIEMDDFGSGYSSLNMLKEVPIDILKLDMRFLSQAGHDSRGGNIISAVIRMANSLELPIIAEGVENVEQANFLKNLGCVVMQGYYFAKPMPADEFKKILIKQSVGTIFNDFKGPGLKNLNELMRTNSNSSFIFDFCIGAAMILEYDGEQLAALLVNDDFYKTVNISRERFERYRNNLLVTMTESAESRLKATLEEAIVFGTAKAESEQKVNERWIMGTYHHVSSGAHSHIFFMLVEDVTKVHEMQAELATVTKDLNTHLEQMPGGLFKYEVDGDQTFAYVSDTVLELLGYTMEEFHNKFNNRFPNFVYKEDRARVLAEIDDEIAVGNYTYCEYRIETADGGLKWVYDVGRLFTDANGKKWFYVIITDMDERKQKLQEQIWQNTMYRTLAEIPGMITYDYDPSVDVLTVRIATENNEIQTLEMPKFLKKIDEHKWLDNESLHKLSNAFMEALKKPMNGKGELRASFDGTDNFKWYRVYYTSVADENGKIYRIAGRADDIDNDMQELSGLKKQAEHDTMTNLLNHDASLEEVGRSIKDNKGGILFVIDVDNFKQVNDKLGHQAGDAVLIKVADTLREIFRKDDILGRFGGDEFIAFIPGSYSKKIATSKAYAMIERVSCIDTSGDVRIGCSIGIAITRSANLEVEEIFKKADDALYESKRNGKGRYTFAVE
ncbi:MAG: EAL domain-containing protein [Lachnospiraceae bacterium]|nr:EAL domain-containing protein [Lachnospiraceae bacterium]